MLDPPVRGEVEDGLAGCRHPAPDRSPRSSTSSPSVRARATISPVGAMMQLPPMW